MARAHKRRESDRPRTPLGWLLKNASSIVAVFVLIGMSIAGLNHFATAADVDRKFVQITIEIKAGRWEDRKKQVEDALFDLRSTRQDASTRAKISRYEAELEDLNAKLRDVEKERIKK